MHTLVKGKVLRGGERHFRRCNTLNGRVVGKVREHYRPVKRTGLPERFGEEVRLLKRDTHCGKNNGKLLVCSAYPRLARNLRRKLCVGKTRSGKNRQLLSPDKGVESVNGGNAGLNELLRIASCGRIHRRSVNVKALFRNDVRSAVNGAAESVKNSSEHILGNSKLHLSAEETHLAFGKIDSDRRLKKLNKSVFSVNFKHAATALFAVFQLDFSKLVVCNAFNVAHKHQRAGNLLNRPVFSGHQSSSPCFAFSSEFSSSAIISPYSFWVSLSLIYLNRPIRSRTGIETIF